MFMRPARFLRSAIVLKPSTLLHLHSVLRKRKYRMLFSPGRRRRPGPKGPNQDLIEAVVAMKRRNPGWGCPRIAQQISLAFGVEIDKDVVRRVLSVHYRPESDSGGPSWLTFLGHTKDIHDKDLSRENTHLLGLIGRISGEATVAGLTVCAGLPNWIR
jgi:hypothetical protein